MAVDAKNQKKSSTPPFESSAKRKRKNFNKSIGDGPSRTIKYSSKRANTSTSTRRPLEEIPEVAASSESTKATDVNPARIQVSSS